MSEHDAGASPFDKNLRSLLDAIAMFEREAGLLLDRFGFDRDTVGRVLDIVSAFSADAVRPLAAALGVADAAAVDALARDVRALLQSDARTRRAQAEASQRLTELLQAVEALGTTTASLADLQSRTQDRLEALAERVSQGDAVQDQRGRIAADLERLTRRIDELEQRLAAELGIGADEPSGEVPAAVKAGATRRQPRAVQPAAGTKILEGLPALEPKIRPA